MALTIAAAPSPLNTLLENAPVQSEALLNKNKPVDCVLAAAMEIEKFIAKGASS